MPRAVLIAESGDWVSDRRLYTPSQKKMPRGFREVYALELKALFAELDGLPQT